MSARVVNLFAGPGSGKSTLASGVFHHLKKEGVNCEFVHEFAKELAWENRREALRDQIYILGNQMRMLHRCMEQVDVIITDTSILYGIIYARKYHQSPYPEEFESLVLSAFRHMDNLNFFVGREKLYSPIGRYQSVEDAQDLDTRIHSTLIDYGIPYITVPGNDDGMLKVLEEVKRRLNVDITDGPMQPDLFGGDTPTRIEK